jgi:transketolase
MFSIEKEVKKHFARIISKKAGSSRKWQATAELEKFIDTGNQKFEITAKGQEIAIRDAGHTYLNIAAAQSPRIIGANADLSSTTKAFVVGGDLIQCGVREFAMSAICNGLALHGFTPYCSTFLSFSDYCRPAVRLTALMNLPVVHIFSHDGAANTPDGPTHQANEHVSALRLIPNMKVFRPCDDAETAATYKWAFENELPACIILSRNKVPPISDGSGVARGGYIIHNAENPNAVLLSAGSEVPLCIAAAHLLERSGLNIRVISIPSFELFDAQPAEYRNKILGGDIPKIAVEMGVSDLWYKYVGTTGKVIGFDEFGHSAPVEQYAHELGFTPENIALVVLEAIKNK